jgi:hypothetical protein
LIQTVQRIRSALNPGLKIRGFFKHFDKRTNLSNWRPKTQPTTSAAWS